MMSAIAPLLPFSCRRLLRGIVLASAANLLSLPVLDAHAAESSRWVSDHLSTYVRSGPTDGHRIVGTLKSGQVVHVIGGQGDYTQVQGEKGDAVWIRSADLQTRPGPSEYVPQLEKQLTELKAQLNSAGQDQQQRTMGMQELLAARKTRIDELETSRQQLDQQLLQAQADLRTAQGQLGNERQQVLMRYFAYGGAVAGGGVLLGLVVPPLFAHSRKRHRQLV